jgi:hypothetical protein
LFFLSATEQWQNTAVYHTIQYLILLHNKGGIYMGFGFGGGCGGGRGGSSWIIIIIIIILLFCSFDNDCSSTC